MSEYDKLRAAFQSANPPRSLYPLLWLHGDERETESVIRAEIAAMDDGGSGGFIIESRPHSDYLGDRWWRDVGYCLDEAAARGMDVWIFDEEYYPSGIAGGRVLEGHPQYRMRVLIKRTSQWDSAADYAPPPGDDAHPMETLLRVICTSGPADGGKRVVFRTEREFAAWRDEVRRDSGADGPGGELWTVHAIGLTPSWSGRMFDRMVDYIDPEVTDRFIELTYEETRRRFAPYWGTTIKGFFGDETSFENFGSYDVLFGEDTPCFPWTAPLAEAFADAKGYELLDWADLLWHETGDARASAKVELARSALPPVRYDFMDVMTRLFSANFFGRLQAWCHRHGVAFIGHVVEDNHAHMHHGYGVGHFFRTTKHFDMGGYDFVLRQLDSEQKRTPYEEQYPQWRHYRDAPYPTFFHFTLPKLAQSAAHLEVGTNLVMCENFGAYGWDLGLREMKWLTDWMTARGTNWYVPHAFSPLFPDPDCPPHFYAGGRNPQWPYFRQWADYANRSCLMLKEGDHVAPVAVLYPAESHWCGDNDRLDEVCRLLSEDQYDFDILSCDLLADETHCLIGDGELLIGRERFRAIVLPGIETLPLAVAVRLRAFAESGGRILAVGEIPAFECERQHAALRSALAAAAAAGGVRAVPAEALGAALRETIAPGIGIGVPFADLRYCHYRRGAIDIFFLRNEGVEAVFDGEVALPGGGVPELWHPMDGRIELAAGIPQSGSEAHDDNDDGNGEGDVVVRLQLEPYEAVFVVLRPAETAAPAASARFDEAAGAGRSAGTPPAHTVAELALNDWRVVECRTPLEGAPLSADLSRSGSLSALGVGDWHAYPELAAFSGTLVYEIELGPIGDALVPLDAELGDGALEVAELCGLLDLGEVGELAAVSVNGHKLAPAICPPYRWTFPLHWLSSGGRITAEITNTLGGFFRDEAFGRRTPAPAGLIGPARLALQSPRRAQCPL
ncbi:glycosyl hydrolase [Cohnella sp. GbtcB17]|uniref:glycosyl hydrolase n=1 Tax=Cohnella sp. GbtcB17 TaxID=2824762 RepID=UPI001C2FCA06|nr:glycosyl hydrolase [Cohnella sp. GbtcB17]